jgi:hypothetical protein
MTRSCYLETKDLFGFLQKIKSMTSRTTYQQFSFGPETNLIVTDMIQWMYSMLVMIEV